MQMPMCDQLVIGGVGSYDDFEASLAHRETPPPAKKSIKETLPFSNVSYDFSAINGEVYWEERKLSYTFEIIADTPEELEEKRAAFANWIMNIANAEIYDPYIEGFHFLGTFDSMDYDDDESVEKSTITVEFAAYPYKIANHIKTYAINVGAGATLPLSVVNNSSHLVQLTVTTDSSIALTIDNATFGLPAGTTSSDRLLLSPGQSVITVTNNGTASVSVSVSFREEVF